MNRAAADIDTRLRRLLPEMRGPVANAITFLLANRDEIPVRSMRELAKRAKVAPVTLVRLAQRLGFEGFEDFRKVFVDAYMAHRGRNLEQAAEIVTLAQKEGALGFAARFAEREIEAQRRAIGELSEKALIGAAEALMQAERVFVVGRRPFFAAAYAFAYALGKARLQVHLLDTGGGLGLEPEISGAGDVLLAFTSHPYSRITLGLAEAAHTHGATVIAITDSERAPIARCAKHVFVTINKSYAFPDSTVGAQLIGNVLVGLTVSRLGAAALDRIRANEGQIERSGEYVAGQPPRGRRRDS
jgi:DNA-binding MurR/RpiR family transcriptional regulator